MGHGSVNKATGLFHDVQWQLTVMTSIDNVFHTCDNDNDFCTIQPLPGANKLHIDEFYIPNRRNILGGIQIAVSKIEAVSFRASTTRTDVSNCLKAQIYVPHFAYSVPHVFFAIKSKEKITCFIGER